MLEGLFDPSGFMPRIYCGTWSGGLIWLHVVSDILIWLAYLWIPIIMARGLLKFRRFYSFSRTVIGITALYVLFITLCGWTHFFDFLMFYVPMYRINGVVRAICAMLSIGTAVSLVFMLPKALEAPAIIHAQKETLNKQFAWLKQILDISTGGKLILCEDELNLPFLDNVVAEYDVLEGKYLGHLRERVLSDCFKAGLTEDQAYDLQLAVHEVAMNTLFHASGSKVQVHSDVNRVLVSVADWGTGIPLDRLPLSTLKGGFSTAGSAGQGWIIALKTTDACHLSTSPTGTVVILEKWKR